jgi:hypothetical protein
VPRGGADHSSSARCSRTAISSAPQGRSRFHPELAVQAVADLGAGSERLRLPAAAVEGQDPLGPQAFAQGVADDERVQLTGDGRMAAAGEVGVDPVLDRSETSLTQPGRLCFEAHAGLDVGQGLAPPQAERVPQHRRGLGRVAGGGSTSGLVDQLEEAMLVDVLISDGEPVAR